MFRPQEKEGKRRERRETERGRRETEGRASVCIPEERLEVVGQLGAAGIAGVHRDEDAVVGVEGDVTPLKDEAVDFHLACLHDGQHLLRDHREHLDVDAVELVEARPCARLGEAREEAAHRRRGEIRAAVHHDALTRQGL
jgi:hypothetical protein